MWAQRYRRAYVQMQLEKVSTRGSYSRWPCPCFIGKCVIEASHQALSDAERPRFDAARVSPAAVGVAFQELETSLSDWLAVRLDTQLAVLCLQLNPLTAHVFELDLWLRQSKVSTNSWGHVTLSVLVRFFFWWTRDKRMVTKPLKLVCRMRYHERVYHIVIGISGSPYWSSWTPNVSITSWEISD